LKETCDGLLQPVADLRGHLGATSPKNVCDAPFHGIVPLLKACQVKTNRNTLKKWFFFSAIFAVSDWYSRLTHPQNQTEKIEEQFIYQQARKQGGEAP